VPLSFSFLELGHHQPRAISVVDPDVMIRSHHKTRVTASIVVLIPCRYEAEA
jgi:hypothetical protein